MSKALFASLVIIGGICIAGLGLGLWRTQRLLAVERRLGDRTRVFKKLFDITRGGLILTDAQGRLLDANPSCSALFGYDRAHLMSIRLGTIIDLSDTGLDGTLALIDAATESGIIETRGYRKDGRPLYLQLTSALIPQSGGNLFVILRDITEHKHAEELRTRYEAQLRYTQKLEAIGTMVNGIAHDFNNILSAILGNVELAQLDVDAHSPAQPSLQEISKAGRRAKELVRRIASFARPQNTQLFTVQLATEVEAALKLVRTTLPSGVELRHRIAADLPHVKVDHAQLEQLLLNLCTNAYQALKDGKGNIDITADVCDIGADATVQHTQLRAGKYVCLNIQDTGSGIDPTITERIFEPFFTTKPRGEGTGLGLSIVHSIVRGHGGAIAFDSVPGRGSTFRIFLPTVTSTTDTTSSGAPTDAPAQPASSVATRATQQHILYVDDEEPLVFLTKRLLERKGYRVTGFTDPKAALAEFLARSDEFDLFITDQSMPQLRGTDLVREILLHKPHTQIILVSGYLRPDEIELARGLGVREVILKPNNVDDLAAAVHRIMSANTN